MGLSRTLKSFSAISFTWFYLFIMLENAEAKIGEHHYPLHTSFRCALYVNCHVYTYLTIIITLYLHNAGGRKHSLIDEENEFLMFQ